MRDPPAVLDVLLLSGVDLLVLDGAPRVLRGRIASAGRLIGETDAAERVRWEAMTRTISFDEVPRVRRSDPMWPSAPSAPSSADAAGRRTRPARSAAFEGEPQG